MHSRPASRRHACSSVEAAGGSTQTYGDNDLGGVDSSLVAVAERLRIETIATLDRRHFGAVRPKHLGGFSIVDPRLDQAAAVSFVASE